MVSAHPNGLESTIPSVRCHEDTMLKQLCPQEQTELQGYLGTSCGQRCLLSKYTEEIKSSKCLSRATALGEVDPQFEARFSTKALFQFRAYYTSPSNVTQHPDLEPTR